MNSDTAVPRCCFAAGLHQPKKAIRAAKAKCVYLADDADDHIRRQVLDLCDDSGTPVSSVASMEELGRRCGIDVGCAVCVELC